MTIGLGEDQTNPELTVNALILGVHIRELLGNTDESLSESEATNAIIKFTGTLAQDVTVFLPDQHKWYVVRNDTSGPYTLTIANVTGGSGVEVPAGDFLFLYCDATDNEVYSLDSAVTFPTTVSGLTINSSTLNGPTINDSTLAGFGEAVSTPTIASGVLTCNLADANFFAVSLTANITSVVFSNVPSGKVVPITIEFTQDGTGGRTVAGWPAGVKWSGGTAPTITADANAVDVVSGYTRDAGTTIRLDLAVEDSK